MFLIQVSQCVPYLKVVKIFASLLIDFLKNSSGEQVTLKLSANSELAGGLVFMPPVEFVNASELGSFTKVL